MKKQYLRFGIIYCIIALLFASAVTVFYTKGKIDEINERLPLRNFSWYAKQNEPDRDLIFQDVLNNWTDYSQISRDDNTGFYSSVIEDGNVILESQDFFQICSIVERTYGEDQIPFMEYRYLLIPDSLDLKDVDSRDLNLIFRSDSITGANCDNAFVYGGTLRVKVNTEDGTEERTAEIGRPTAVDVSKGVPFEEWQTTPDYYYARSYLFKNEKYNTEARKLALAYIADCEAGVESGDYKTDNGIFTSTASRTYELGNGKYRITYFAVVKPLGMALTDNAKTYIAILIAFLLVEAGIIFSTRMLYLNQKSYELRSQKLTRGIAHELKTPLAITKTCVENWEYLDEKDRPEYSKKIISEVDHMSGMITKLLELSKISGGNVKLNREDVDLMLLTKNIKNRNSALILERGIDVSITGDEKDGTYLVNADLDMMNIVISNFMSNAIKYCDHTIKISINRVGRRIEFQINNDGAKIAKIDQNKVWDIFYTTDNARTNRMSNSGVGLAVVKSILDLHKAKYGCYSSAKGTVFWFSMDACRKE